MENCLMCKGDLEKGNVNHIVDLDNFIIIIKNVPAKVCKQCGEYYLEHKVALEIEKIIDNYRESAAELTSSPPIKISEAFSAKLCKHISYNF